MCSHLYGQIFKNNNMFQKGSVFFQFTKLFLHTIHEKRFCNCCYLYLNVLRFRIKNTVGQRRRQASQILYYSQAKYFFSHIYKVLESYMEEGSFLVVFIMFL